MMNKLFDFIGGIALPYHKMESVNTPVRQAKIPSKLILPLSQHIGESAEATLT